MSKKRRVKIKKFVSTPTMVSVDVEFRDDVPVLKQYKWYSHTQAMHNLDIINALCPCAFHAWLREYTKNGTKLIVGGAWLDPRRRYSEQEDEFLKRVPDGFIKAPDNCYWNTAIWEKIDL